MLNPKDKELLRTKVDAEILKLRKEKAKYEKLINNNEKIITGYQENVKELELKTKDLEELLTRII